jgi:hypothetical protein
MPSQTPKHTHCAERKRLIEMSPAEIRTWIHATREHLRNKMQRERSYLDRRAARRIHTLTDEAYEADQVLEADLLALLDEMEESLEAGGQYAI